MCISVTIFLIEYASKNGIGHAKGSQGESVTRMIKTREATDCYHLLFFS